MTECVSAYMCCPCTRQHATSELACGDIIATEAKYHPRCLLNLYYKAGRAKSSEYKDGMDENLSEISGEVLALADEK